MSQWMKVSCTIELPEQPDIMSHGIVCFVSRACSCLTSGRLDKEEMNRRRWTKSQKLHRRAKNLNEKRLTNKMGWVDEEARIPLQWPKPWARKQRVPTTCQVVRARKFFEPLRTRNALNCLRFDCLLLCWTLTTSSGGTTKCSKTRITFHPWLQKLSERHYWDGIESNRVCHVIDVSSLMLSRRYFNQCSARVWWPSARQPAF